MASDSRASVDDAVALLTSSEGLEGDGEARLREQLQRAADDFDEEAASALGKTLFDDVTRDPGNRKKLEALVILGLAHASVLQGQRVSLSVEARRLAGLLDRGGDRDRARGMLDAIARAFPGERPGADVSDDMLRRSGGTAELVDRYLRRAEEFVQKGRPMEAVPWLQQVLLLDRSRRDVARMIRDLRYQESERKIRVRRRTRLTLFVLLLSASITGVVVREMRIEEAYGGLPEAEEGNLESLQVRLADIEGLIDRHGFWVGMFRADNERAVLQDAIDGLQVRANQERRDRLEELARQAEMADAARHRGLRAVERGDYESALADLRQALELASEDWPYRARVEADVAAIEAWREQNR